MVTIISTRYKLLDINSLQDIINNYKVKSD